MVNPRPPAQACLLTLLGCLAIGCASAPRDEGATPTPIPVEKEGWSKESKVLAVNAALGAGVLAYGFQFWGYGGDAFRFSDEGWFGKDTENGGSDKLGHAYAAYIGTLGLAALYESFGYEQSEAALLGALSAGGAMAGIEIADGISHYGFSWQDLVADGIGVLGGYVRRRVPSVKRYLDFRVEYWPSITAQRGRHTDIATDYSGYKYVLALKLEGFQRLEPTPLGWLELQTGYYTKGYGAGDEDYYDRKERHFFVGVGLNLNRVFARAGLERVGRVFQYYQPPYTHLPYTWSSEH